MGCNLYVNESNKYNDDNFTEKINIPLSEHRIPVVHETQILNYIKLLIDYEYEGEIDRWQSFRESIEIGKGDCEDFCVAFCDILKRKFNKDAEIVLVDTETMVDTGETYYNTVRPKSRKIEAGGWINHAMVRVDDVIVDPLDGKIYNAVVSYSYTINCI